VLQALQAVAGLGPKDPVGAFQGRQELRRPARGFEAAAARRTSAR
jgi:hypothetical protein